MNLIEFANHIPRDVWLMIGLSFGFVVGLYLCED